MPEGAKYLIAFAVLACVICLIKMIKSRHFVRCMLISVLSGAGSLAAVNLLTSLTGVRVGINPFSVAFCSLTGAGGTITLLISELFSKLS